MAVHLVLALFLRSITCKLAAMFSPHCFPCVCCSKTATAPFSWSTGAHSLLAGPNTFNWTLIPANQHSSLLNSCPWHGTLLAGTLFPSLLSGRLPAVTQRLPTLCQRTLTSVKAHHKRARLPQNQKGNSPSVSCQDSRLHCHKQLPQSRPHPSYPDCIVSLGSSSPNPQLFT